jgi:hypothetical protein
LPDFFAIPAAQTNNYSKVIFSFVTTIRYRWSSQVRRPETKRIAECQRWDLFDFAGQSHYPGR